jgi:hypothetical protein
MLRRFRIGRCAPRLHDGEIIDQALRDEPDHVEAELAVLEVELSYLLLRDRQQLSPSLSQTALASLAFDGENMPISPMSWRGPTVSPSSSSRIAPWTM